MNVWDLDTPRLVVDLDRVEANVAEMARRARDAGVRLRPHTKTHKMPAIARLQIAAGAAGLTCAKLGEAEVMVDAGCDDVLVAFPLTGDEKLARLARLRERARVVVSLDSLEVARGLGALGVASRDPVEVYVEVDTGLHRLGRPPGPPTVELVRQVADVPGLRVLGLMSHAGHAYGVAPAERERLVDQEIDDLTATRDACAALGIDLPEISVGSTPTVRSEMARAGVTEVRPGTYVFNDTTMIDLGVATVDSCAAHVLATVVSRPHANRFVIDAGSKCFTSDGEGRPGWIRVAGREDLSMEFTNEEHGVGVIDTSSSRPLTIGDKLQLIPAHVCPVINLFDHATVVRGERVVDEFEVAGRGRVR